MADGWARLSGRPGIVSVHQGPGLTNAITGITEAAKSRTPMVVLAADVAAGAVRSNFRIDVAGLASAIGAVPAGCTRRTSPSTTRCGRTGPRRPSGRTVILALPLDVQAGECPVPPVEVLNAARAATEAAGHGLTGLEGPIPRAGPAGPAAAGRRGPRGSGSPGRRPPRGRAARIRRWPRCAERQGQGRP